MSANAIRSCFLTISGQNCFSASLMIIMALTVGAGHRKTASEPFKSSEMAVIVTCLDS